MSPHQQQARTYTLHSSDERVHVTVHCDRPAYVYIRYEGLTEEEIDAALLNMAWLIPAPCWGIVLPAFSETQGE